MTSTSSLLRLLAAALIVGSAASAQTPACLPFAIGERMEFNVRVAMMGAKGKATMTVDGPAFVRGHSTFALSYEADVGMGFLRGTDRTTSYVDTSTFASLRFIQREQHIIARGIDSVEIFPDEHRWERNGGRMGTTQVDAPLDALSFIYFLRSLPLASDTSWTVSRHFDDARNPTFIRVAGHDTVDTPGGRYTGWTVEMHVRDTLHYSGKGLIRVFISDDARRIPVRIQSVMPMVGTTVMTLNAYRPAPIAGCAAPVAADNRTVALSGGKK